MAEFSIDEIYRIQKETGNEELQKMAKLTTFQSTTEPTIEEDGSAEDDSESSSSSSDEEHQVTNDINPDTT
jgi:hypothetical protein